MYIASTIDFPKSHLHHFIKIRSSCCVETILAMPYGSVWRAMSYVLQIVPASFRNRQARNIAFRDIGIVRLSSRRRICKLLKAHCLLLLCPSNLLMVCLQLRPAVLPSSCQLILAYRTQCFETWTSLAPTTCFQRAQVLHCHPARSLGDE